MYDLIPKGELIMTPENPMFDWILNTSPPPGWRNQITSDFQGFFAVDAETGIMRPLMNAHEYVEYCEGGELDERPNPLDDEGDYFEVSYL